jgi:hypothetical protein
MKTTLMFLMATLAFGTARAAGTQAVSREATYYILPTPATLAVSREAVFFVPGAATQAVSHEATFFVNYGLADVARALRLAAGLDPATTSDRQLLNVQNTGPSASVVDVLDAAALAGFIGHPERLP